MSIIADWLLLLLKVHYVGFNRLQPTECLSITPAFPNVFSNACMVVARYS